MNSPAAKRARKIHSLAKKLEILSRLEKHEAVSKLAKEFGVGSSTIYDIKAAKEKLRSFAVQQESSKSLEKRFTLKTCHDPELDQMLLLWFKQERSRGVPLSGNLLRAKALHFWEKLHPGNSTFTASDGWLTRWKR